MACATEEENYAANPTVFEPIQYITLTNENTGGGSQIAYVLSGTSQDGLTFCFCQEECTREFVVVAELEFNSGTTDFRYKINLDDDFQTGSSRDWCTRFE
jgi:hypothetical protein